jgi:hypothetical protein
MVECVPAFRRLAEKTHSSILFVSRDDNNLRILTREFAAFTDPGGGRGIRHTDAQTLLANARDATAAEYRAFIMELLNVPGSLRRTGWTMRHGSKLTGR